MSVTESDIEGSTDSDFDVTEPTARSRPRSSQSIRSEANIHDVHACEVRVLLFIVVVFFNHSALLETPIQFSAFSVQEAKSKY